GPARPPRPRRRRAPPRPPPPRPHRRPAARRRPACGGCARRGSRAASSSSREPPPRPRRQQSPLRGSPLPRSEERRVGRDRTVTGVQTCALPIWDRRVLRGPAGGELLLGRPLRDHTVGRRLGGGRLAAVAPAAGAAPRLLLRGSPLLGLVGSNLLFGGLHF